MLASVESVVSIVGTKLYATVYEETKLLAYPGPG